MTQNPAYFFAVSSFLSDEAIPSAFSIPLAANKQTA